MSYKVIKYTLTSDGNLPEFLYTGQDSVLGTCAVPTGLLSPQDFYYIGISQDGATGDFFVFETKADLQAYLETNGVDWGTWAEAPTEQIPNSGIWVPFDPTVTTNEIWANMEALNAN